MRIPSPILIALLSILTAGFARPFLAPIWASSARQSVTSARASALEQATAQAPAIPEIIVKERADAPPIVPQLVNVVLGAQEVDRNRALGAKLLALPKNLSAESLAAVYQRLPWVEYAEPNATVRIAAVSTDPIYEGLQKWYYDLLDAPRAWDVTTGSPDIVVAVIDTGVDVRHEDLAVNIWRNLEETPDNGWDDDNNGCIDDVQGCNFTVEQPDGDVRDDHGHGTLMAGIIAAIGDNGVGGAGVSWRSKVMPIKVLNNQGFGSTFNVAKGIVYAAENGAHIINLSFGRPLPSQILADAISEMYKEYGVIVVAASGNLGVQQVDYPAALANVIAVGASDRNDPDRRWPGSNWGPEITVVAPGKDICGPIPDSKYACGTGTSMSAALVSGLVALLLSRDPSLTLQDVLWYLRYSSVSLPDETQRGWDGWGRINIGEALNANPQRSFLPGVTRD